MDTDAPTGARARTRRAILDAALTVLAQNAAASLADIAVAAGVGRTTIHRYFPERSDLLAAIGTYLLERIDAATVRARLEDGAADAALERVCQEYFELGDALLFAFENPSLAQWAGWETETESDRALARLVERGHAEGALDPRMPASWVSETMWALLYTAWQHTRTNEAPKHAALDLCLHTLRKATRAG
ncbi:DNA-binding transcriptional regulator, AcrR family [Nonomuraea solani]|uniref:DNA-binding transcriptional regulator, AcrR family n=1 Tax=Nonomuraea solani TaxID=1144553 RepID=A0A1H6EPX0_9ACTN|nr:TetR/AcrR family transcriptional regulator [Nonomuraea solani]SEG99918.1 DNA-binding transcriptional regulator, AcrR family [Nonomuraea solani]